MLLKNARPAIFQHHSELSGIFCRATIIAFALGNYSRNAFNPFRWRDLTSVVDFIYFILASTSGLILWTHQKTTSGFTVWKNCTASLTIQADIIKQKMSDLNGGYKAVNLAKPTIRSTVNSQMIIRLTFAAEINCYMGCARLINSGGASSDASDLADAVTTAVINIRARGMGLISENKNIFLFAYT